MAFKSSLALSLGLLLALAAPAPAQTSTATGTDQTSADRPSGGPPHHPNLTTAQMQSIKACATKAGITLPDPPPEHGQNGQGGPQGGPPPQGNQASGQSGGPGNGQGGPQGGPPGMPQLTDAQRQALDACFAAAGASK